MNVSTLFDCLEKDKIVDVFRDRLTQNDSITGFIIALNTELMLIARVDSNGNNDGFSIIKNEDVSRIRWNSNQLVCIGELYTSNKYNSIVNEEIKTNILDSLEYVNKNYGYVNIFIEEDNDDVCFIGEIIKIDSNVILNEYSPMDRLGRSTIIIPINSITRIDFNGEYEISLMKLYQNMKKI